MGSAADEPLSVAMGRWEKEGVGRVAVNIFKEIAHTRARAKEKEKDLKEG